MEKKLEIYIHIPFCVKKCRYCDFLSFPGQEPLIRAYADRLAEEIRKKGEELRIAGDLRPVCSVFLGGGTPSILEVEQTGDLMRAVRESFTLAEEPEITMECNPGTLTREKLSAWRRAGIGRLSIGLQSASDRELACLGRIHTWKEFEENYFLAREAGFSNINVDLISALPEQTPQSWRQTLEKVLKLEPEHISAYSLIIEEGTPFYEIYREDAERRERGEKPVFLPSEEEEREMYRDTEKLLGEAGYGRYEISNYAQRGYTCRHNIGYWEREDYLGFGLGAASLYKNTRYHNTENLERYLNGDREKEEIQVLSEKEQMEETMFLGLRLTEGVNLKKFEEEFGIPCEAVFGEQMERLTKQGLLRRNGERLCLTERGLDLANYVMAEFV